jgi:uncharacterized membrane protein
VDVSGDATGPDAGRFVSTKRLEGFSDGVFAIAVTLLVLDLAISRSGSPLDRVFDAWPFYLAYVVSFLTIGAAWLAHNGMTERLERADAILLRINLLLLLFVSFLPFPTRLVAEGIRDTSGERVFVTMYGLTLLAVRLLLSAIDRYARREQLYSGAPDDDEPPVLPVVIAYAIAILMGLALPEVAVGLYCALALFLVIPFRELTRLFARHP